MTYRIKEVEATQFDPESEQLPEGVTLVQGYPVSHMFIGPLGRSFVSPGDYIITSPGPSRLMRQDEFETMYELAP